MEKQIMSVIAESLKKIRTRAGYSIEALAKLLGVERETVSKWEDGTEEPTLSMGLLLSKLYGVSVNDIFCNVEVDREIPEENREDFCHNAWVNRVSNRRYC